MITGTQCKMARAGLGWGVRDLAAKAEVGASTVNRFELDQAQPIPATVAALQRALEAAGAQFADGGWVSVNGKVQTAPQAEGIGE